MITREQKKAITDQVVDRIKKSQAFFLVDFKGLKVEQVTQLRKNLFTLNAEMKVIRNTLALRALHNHGMENSNLENIFTGNNAFVFAYKDPADVAKTLSQFSKNFEIFKIKSGFMEGKLLNSKQIDFLATLPSLEIMRSQFLGVLLASGSKLVRTLNEVPTSLARVLKAKSEQNPTQ